MKSLREQLSEALTEAKSINEAAKDRDFTDDEQKRIVELKSSTDELQAKIKTADEAKAASAALMKSAVEEAGRKNAVDLTHLHDERPNEPEAKAVPSGIGDVFVKSATYKEWKRHNPSGLGEGSNLNLAKTYVGGQKSDPNPLSVGSLPNGSIPAQRLPTVDLAYPKPLDFLDLISYGTIDGPSFDYLQITSVTRNAALVPDEIKPGDITVKPLSDMGAQLATGKVYTYADGYTVTNQMLSDAGAFASYLNSQLGYNIKAVIQDKLLNGSGTSGEPTGLLKTTGVQHQGAVDVADPLNIPKTVRKAIGLLNRIGAPITAIVLSPEDAETLDLMEDANKRFYGQGPFGVGPTTLWGHPYVVSQALTEGTALVGNMQTIQLLQREPLSIEAFNQHADYARRNLVYVRAEQRSAQVIYKPAEIVVCNFKAPQGK